jgi:CRISPR-associated protein Cmr5
MKMRDLEQKRAAKAWLYAESSRSNDYMNLTKAAPALIMGNGLMQTLAFFKSKGKPHHLALNKQITDWLAERFAGVGKFPADGKSDFSAVMKALYEADSIVYRQVTEETMAFLKWLRQFASAVNASRE